MRKIWKFTSARQIYLPPSLPDKKQQQQITTQMRWIMGRKANGQPGKSSDEGSYTVSGVEIEVVILSLHCLQRPYWHTCGYITIGMSTDIHLKRCVYVLRCEDNVHCLFPCARAGSCLSIDFHRPRAWHEWIHARGCLSVCPNISIWRGKPNKAKKCTVIV